MYSADYLIEAKEYIKMAEKAFNENREGIEVWNIQKAIQKLDLALEFALKESKE
jgi:hypothetical protein